MRRAKVVLCVALVGCIGVGATGCGVFDLLTAASGATKLFGGQASGVTSSEWMMMSRTAAGAAGVPALALSDTEAAAIADFLSQNNINDLSTIGDQNPNDLEGLTELAQAFQERAGDQYDLTDPQDAEQFFQDYGQELGQALAGALQGFGVQIPT